MVNKVSRQEIRVKKHNRIRNRFSGTAQRPRLSVFRSNNHIYAQVIDDAAGKTLVSASTAEKDAKAELINVGLEDKLNSYPKELSGGQQQRVSIARALVKDSKILLCDEPTGALDSESEKVILKLLLDIKTKYHKTIILVTHKQEISELADRVLIMKNGSIIEDKINEMPKTLEEIIW